MSLCQNIKGSVLRYFSFLQDLGFLKFKEEHLTEGKSMGLTKIIILDWNGNIVNNIEQIA